jgi:hypothetical protein
MSNESIIQIFEGINVRIVWNEEKQEYYFSIADIVQVLTDSTDVKQYIKRMRARDPELNLRWGTICTPTRMKAADGKYYQTQAATLEGVFRVIQSIPSKKAEPLKQWLAEIGKQRIDQMIDPELTFQMAVEDYRRQGYSDKWIENRMKSIRTRNELTNEWKRSGVTEQKDYAMLTNILTKAWSGMTTGQYKTYKGLTKENLRDNMTTLELALNTLAEAATTEISRHRNPKTMTENKQVAQSGGNAAKLARKDIERQIGHSVISPEKASDYLLPADDAEVKEIEE